jgi:hypothetical protein
VWNDLDASQNDFPLMQTPEDLKQLKRELIKDHRRVKHSSFLSSLDQYDSHRHKHSGEPYMLPRDLYKDISDLYELLCLFGVLNIFIVSQATLLEKFKIDGKRPARDLKNKLESLEKRMVICYYYFTKSLTQPQDYYKIILNPNYGFVYAMNPRPVDTDTGEIYNDQITDFYTAMLSRIDRYYKAWDRKLYNLTR